MRGTPHIFNGLKNAKVQKVPTEAYAFIAAVCLLLICLTLFFLYIHKKCCFAKITKDKRRLGQDMEWQEANSDEDYGVGDEEEPPDVEEEEEDTHSVTSTTSRL